MHLARLITGLLSSVSELGDFSSSDQHPTCIIHHCFAYHQVQHVKKAKKSLLSARKL